MCIETRHLGHIAFGHSIAAMVGLRQPCVLVSRSIICLLHHQDTHVLYLFSINLKVQPHSASICCQRRNFKEYRLRAWYRNNESMAATWCTQWRRRSYCWPSRHSSTHPSALQGLPASSLYCCFATMMSWQPLRMKTRKLMKCSWNL